MLGIVSALMLAVLTERTFLIHWPDDACADVAEYMGSEWIDWRMPKNFRHSVSPTDQEYLLNFQPFTGFEMSEKMRRFNPRELDSKAIIWMRASHGLFIDLWRNPHLSPELCKYGFNTVDETYSLLSRLLLSHTHNQLSHLVARSLASVAGKFMIGLQMRFIEVSRLSIFDVDRFYAAALAIESQVL
mmetsp:Transcript_33670/g.54259  ORF Transcript_33670/g.54259 Transcript_33670/m.54259 type:complete len:187 (-) Transcript_33670:271-831(-)